jgi:hypothetical protein
MQGGGIKQFAAAVVGVSAIGCAVGFFSATTLLLIGQTQPSGQKTPASDAAPATGANGHEAEATGEGTGDEAEVALDEPSPLNLKVVEFSPVIANLAEPKSVWIRLEGKLLFAPDGEATESVAAAHAAQSILSYFRTLKLTEVEAAGSLQAISQDLNEMVRSTSKGQVQGVLISGLVLE